MKEILIQKNVWGLFFKTTAAGEFCATHAILVEMMTVGVHSSFNEYIKPPIQARPTSPGFFLEPSPIPWKGATSYSPIYERLSMLYAAAHFQELAIQVLILLVRFSLDSFWLSLCPSFSVRCFFSAGPSAAAVKELGLLYYQLAPSYMFRWLRG
jgi:hypothetical protein